jgi:hypothetical protein
VQVVSSTVRAKVQSVKKLLQQTKISPLNAGVIAERLQTLDALIEQQPQFSAVRPATIALRNLIVSLRRPDLSTELANEVETAIETLAELLEDETFGIESDDIRAQIATELRAKRLHVCAMCRHPELTIEPIYILMKPFPSDPVLAPSQLPCAIVVCKACGFMWMHDLAILGVL